MSLTLVQFNSNTTGFGSSFTTNYNSATTAGNLLVACFATYYTTSFLTPVNSVSGWTEVTSVGGGASDDSAVSMFYLANASSKTSVTGTNSGSNNWTDAAAVVLEFSGVVASSPFDTDATNSNTLTPASNGELVVQCSGAGLPSGVSSITAVTVTNFGTFSVGDILGSTGSVTGTGSGGGSTGSFGILAAFKVPASAVPPPWQVPPFFLGSK